MRKLILLALLALSVPANAQSGPKFGKNGGVGSSSSTFDTGEPVGGTYAINGTTGRVSAPIVNLRPAAAPSSPLDGDCWTTTGGYFCRISGVTVGPYAGLSSSNTWSANQTINGDLTVAATGTARSIKLSNNAGFSRSFFTQTAGVNRWAFGATGTAETGSNVGSDFSISRFNDAGTFQDIPFRIYRDFGAIELGSAGSSITAAAPITAPYFKPTTAECANILHYGADRTGAVASDAAFANAVAASQPAKICVYLPSGTYQFASQKTITLASSPAVASVTIRGDGADVTNLNFASNTSGLEINLASAFHSFHIQDLSVLAGTFSTGTKGISITQAATLPNPAVNAPSDVSRVTVRGADGYSMLKGFGKSISFDAVSNVSVSSTYMYGPEDVTLNNSTCMALSGRTASNAVVFNISQSAFLTCSTGLEYGTAVEGVNVAQSNFVGVLVGIIVPVGSTDASQLAAIGNHINAYKTAIDLEVDPGGVSIIGNYITANTAIGAANGIIMRFTQDYNITGNVISRAGSGTVGGIIINEYGTHSGIISGNTFNNMATGISLLGASQRVTVGVNSFATTVTTPITNSGTNNIVATSCTAAPTAGFRVTNGVITAC